ncbi:SgcJ/EcaC family oxidoreductase [Allosphingosinicella sp.]|uniref:SgcJ/EcaC family oxidoreductase n=1 Tax=Allosphingosinicella sp. TaxID=2823234 RepID=UPI003783FBE8
MRFVAFAAAVAATLIAAPAAAHPADDAINQLYGRLTEAKAHNDAAGIAAAFAPEALLIDARPGAATSGAEFAARLAPMAARMSADGVTVATQYRIERRSFAGDVAIDAGYMRQEMRRAAGAQPMTMITRFLVTLRRQADGSWRILSDASMPSTEAAWTGAVRAEGLRYDS